MENFNNDNSHVESSSSSYHNLEGLVPDEPIIGGEEYNNNNNNNNNGGRGGVNNEIELIQSSNSSSCSSSNKKQYLLKRYESKEYDLFKGGTIFDGFLLAAAAEVGQSILTLPNIFAQLGFVAGLVFEILFASLALYTNYLLVSMHAQYRYQLRITNDPKHNNKYYIASYHEIMEYLVGLPMKHFSLFIVFFALLGLTTVQIIATSSNFYILSPSINKRTWSLIWGFIFSSILFVPTFRHYRVLAIFGILTTTYTAWFMTIYSIIEGHHADDDVIYDAPNTVEGFFSGLVQLLFIYGGHTSNIEVADVMDNPANYDKSYFWSYLYVFTLTMPNAVAAYWAFGGDDCRNNANAFALFERTLARDFGIVLMTIHQGVAFGMFAGPLFHMWEKLIRVDSRPFRQRVLYRIPLVMCMVFLAVAFPFFGAVNAVLGAFTTSFGTYIIPVIGYNLAFPGNSTQGMVKKPPKWIPGGLKGVRILNWLIAIFVIGAGVGAGGYFSIQKFIDQIHQFEYFAECYQCYN